jgi:S1-C subfamily serine protease
MAKTLWTLAIGLAATASAVAQDDDRTKRILDRIEKEIRDSEGRLRDEIREILRSELRRDPAARPAPPPPARRRVLLGITADEFTDAERKKLGIGGGIKVADVRGPAAEAGVKVGDVVLELDGQPVSEDSIGAVLEKKKPGDAVEAQILRGGKREKVRITLGERKD